MTDNAAVKKFFTVTDSVSSELNKVIIRLRSDDNKSHFIASFVQNNGYPLWNKVLTNASDQRANSAGRAGSNMNEAIFFIPLQAADSSIQSYIVCVKSDTNYLFRCYNKNAISSVNPTDTTKRLLIKSALSVFAYFEKTINGHDSVSFQSQIANRIKDVTITFQQETSGKHTSGRLSEYGVVLVDICGWSWHQDGYNVGDAPGEDHNLSGSYQYGCTTTFMDAWIEEAGSPIDNTSIGPSDSGNISGSTSSANNGYLQDRILLINDKLAQNPYYLVPCDYLDQFKSLGSFLPLQDVLNRIESLKSQYQQNAQQASIGVFPIDPVTGLPIISTSPYSSPLYVQTINNAAGAVVNCDYFPVHITQMPKINGVEMTPQDLLIYFRKKINNFIDNNLGAFYPYKDGVVDDNALWYSDNPLGALLHLNLILDGTVIVSDYQISNAYNFNNHYTVTTMCTPLDARHPVSGNRSWGIQPDVNGGYTFYVQGVDRITGNDIQFWNEVASIFGPNGFDRADKLWRSLQDGMIKFITDNGGQAIKYPTPEIILRTNWDWMNQYFQGQISLEELRQKIGC